MSRLTLAMLQALFGNSFIIRLALHCFSIRTFLIRIQSSAVIFVILGKICISKHADVDSKQIKYSKMTTENCRNYDVIQLNR